MPLHENMRKLLSSYSDSELAFLLDVLTKSLDQTHQELIKQEGLYAHLAALQFDQPRLENA